MDQYPYCCGTVWTELWHWHLRKSIDCVSKINCLIRWLNCFYLQESKQHKWFVFGLIRPLHFGFCTDYSNVLISELSRCWYADVVTFRQRLAISPCFQSFNWAKLTSCKLVLTIQLWEWYRTSHLTLRKKANLSKCRTISLTYGAKRSFRSRLPFTDRHRFIIFESRLCKAGYLSSFFKRAPPPHPHFVVKLIITLGCLWASFLWELFWVFDLFFFNPFTNTHTHSHTHTQTQVFLSFL